MEERNWYRRSENSWTCDRMGEDFNCCPPHLIIDMEEDGVKIRTYYCGRTIKTESLRSRDEVDGLIQALEEARDTVFE